MVVACRGDGVELVGVDGAEVISLREAAGPPEGGKCWAGAARRWKRCSQLVRMTQSRLPVSLFLKFTGIVPVQETQKTQGELFATLLQLRAAAARAVMGEREASRSH